VAEYNDKTSGAAINELKAKPGTISGADMQNCIVKATQDHDSNAASGEFKDLQKFSTDNWDRMSPDAREKFRTYEKYATAAQGKGQTGIDTASYDKMVGEMKTAGYKDATSGAAVETLKSKQPPISGDDMQKAIIDATQDNDNKAAGPEYQDLKKYASDNWKSLSPEAQAKFNTYEKYAQAAQKQGKTGIDDASYNKMTEEMKVAGYKDKGSGAAINELKGKTPPISGADMQSAIIQGTQDPDNRAASSEYKDFKKYATENWNNLSPDAKDKFRVYEKYATAAQQKGQRGIPVAEYDKMTAEMKTAGYKDPGMGAALEELKSKGGKINGAEFEKALGRGTVDLDNQAAGAEFADMQRFAKENWGQMSASAREKYRIYEEYASHFQAAGKTGIDQRSYDQMMADVGAIPNDLGFVQRIRI
jgi:hypothetical protein